ncbi:hypothetical protein GCM10027515_10240 [Schumannella luteola]|uniref:DUF4190 domain-containing protein n=1 Tax=Schumannella luteola TaxID=472059 RepID=A0A852Y5G2_9MICO|nr:hypothetical protein [Schumannella luteola]NYG97473.1 hypothetical protein [Schumannella luteola]TPX05890.1 hypothetical protein FJ656_04130 [Schumannella luteola]
MPEPRPSDEPPSEWFAPEQPSPQARPRHDVLGVWSLSLAVLAAIMLAVPIIGDALSLPPALAAVIVGFIALRRHETGASPYLVRPLIGTIVGGLAVVVAGMLMVVTALVH